MIAQILNNDNLEWREISRGDKTKILNSQGTIEEIKPVLDSILKHSKPANPVKYPAVVINYNEYLSVYGVMFHYTNSDR